MKKSSYWLTVVTVHPYPRSEYARHATDIFTVLQNTLASCRVIRTLTHTTGLNAGSRVTHCHTEVHVQPTNPDDELTTIAARALIDLEGPNDISFDKTKFSQLMKASLSIPVTVRKERERS